MRPSKRNATADPDANAAATKNPKLAGVDAIPVASTEQGTRDLVVLSNSVRKALEVEAAAIVAEEAMTTPMEAANVPMARVAENVPPQVEEDEATLLEELDQSTNRFSVDNLYCWDREKELGERGSGRSRMHAIFERRIPEHDLPKEGLVEIDLKDFAEWYQGLRFHDFLKKPTKVQWRVKVVFFFPNTREVTSDAAKVRKRLIEFYQGRFNVAMEEDHKSIMRCVNRHPSILIVAKKTNSDEQARSIIRPTKNAKGRLSVTPYAIVGAITYCMSSYTGEKVLAEPTAFIAWFATCCKKKPQLSGLHNNCWGGNGFGMFLLTLVIKRCALQAKSNPDGSLPPLRLYLQSQPLMKEVSAYYAKLGFIQINDENVGHGKHMLPTVLSKRLDDGTFVEDAKPPMKLLCLQYPRIGPVSSRTENDIPRIVTLFSPSSEVASAVDLSVATPPAVPLKKAPNLASRHWCHFPSSQFADKKNQVTEEDFSSTIAGLTLWNWLVPPSSYRLMPPERHTIHGEVLFGRRMWESKSSGTKWMSTGEIEAGLALLMADGRYSDDVVIIPPSYSGLVAAGYASELKHDELTRRNTQQFGSVDHMELAGASNDANDCLTEVVKKIIKPHPELLKKKLIVFVADEKNCHWTVTFVFNPGTVASEHEEDQPRCCFYRYCGYDAYGQTLVAHTHGLKWFLNLAYSVEKHDEMHGTQAGENALQTLEPFGKGEDDVRDKYLHGTKCFPSVMFEDTSTLPKQYDSYNCGVAVLAATAIILRDLVTGRDNESYEKLFNMERLPVRFNMDKDEHYVILPAGTLLHSDLLNDKSFLSNVKAELYVIFDRLADLEHVVIPKRVGHSTYVNDEYLKIKEGLKWPPPPVVAKETRPPTDVLERPERFLPEETQRPEHFLPEVTQEVTQDGDVGEDESTRRQTAAAGTLLDLAVATSPEPAKNLLAEKKAQRKSLKLKKKAVQRKTPKAKHSLPSNSSSIMDKEAMNEFVRQKFEEWGWHTHKEHNSFMKGLDEELETTTGEAARKELERFIKKNKVERKYFTRLLEMEYFLTSDATLVGLKYNKETEKFTASTESKVIDPHNPDETKICFKQLELDDDTWVREVISEELINKAIEMASAGHDTFMQIPIGVKTKLLDKAVVRVKCIPYSKSTVVDTKALAKMKRQQIKKRLAKMKTSKRMGREIIELENDLKVEPDFETPMMVVEHPEQWLAQTDDGTTIMVDLDWVIGQFGHTYAEDLRDSRRGFVDVPVGDSKPSHLQEWPNLLVDGLPENHYRQPEGMNLCLPNALASVLHVLGFQTSAAEISFYGATHIGAGATDTLDLVYEKAKACLPNWVQITRIKNPQGFDWEKNLEDRTIMLAVLTTSDGHRSHGVAIHGGLIYDANEATAIPLCKEGLDYCSSTQTKRCEFVEFHKGLLFQYNGTDIKKLKRLSRPATENEMKDDLMVQ